MKYVWTVGLALMLLAGIPSLATATDAPKKEEVTVASVPTDKEVSAPTDKEASVPITTGVGMAVGLACVGAGLAAIGGGYAIGRVGSHCIDSMARQPEAANAMFAPMVVTAAMIEGATFFAIAVALLAVLKIIP